MLYFLAILVSMGTAMTEYADRFPYKSPIDLEQIKARVNNQFTTMMDRSVRYRKNADRYRFWSVLLRLAALATVVLFVFATYIFPDQPMPRPDSPSDIGYWYPAPEKLAMFFLLLTGVFVLADQAITGTASWARHKLAELLTAFAAEKFDQVTIGILANVPDGEVSQEIVNKVEGAITVSQTEMQKIEREELDSWRQGVDAAWSAIQKRITVNKDAVEAAYETQQKASEEADNPKKGVLKVIVNNTSKLDKAELVVGGAKSNWPPETRSRVFEDQPVGMQKISLSGNLSTGKSFIVEDVVMIKANTVQEIAINLGT